MFELNNRAKPYCRLCNQLHYHLYSMSFNIILLFQNFFYIHFDDTGCHGDVSFDTKGYQENDARQTKRPRDTTRQTKRPRVIQLYFLQTNPYKENQIHLYV